VKHVQKKTSPSVKTEVLLALALCFFIVLSHVYWPQPMPMPCAASQLRVDDAGLLSCNADGACMEVGGGLTLGLRPSLNAIAEAELAAISGIGRKVAHALVLRRSQRPFVDWDDVETVRGVGPQRLSLLMEMTEIGTVDGGLW
jgi:competence protein ComEA